jgi:hypothetical protein
MSPGAGTRRTVDERDPGGAQAGELRVEVVRAVRDVVQSLAAALEKAVDRGSGTQGLDELDGADERDAHALGLENLWGSTGGADDELEGPAAGFDGVNGHGDVVE